MKYEIGKRIKNGLYIRLYHSPLVDGWVANLWFQGRSPDLNTSGLVGYPQVMTMVPGRQRVIQNFNGRFRVAKKNLVPAGRGYLLAEPSTY